MTTNNNKDLNSSLETEEVLWKLEDLYVSETDESLESDIIWCEKEAATINKEYYGKITSLQADEILNVVTRLETLDANLTKLATYSFLNFTTKMDNSTAGALDQRVREVVSRCSTKTVFFELEWNKIADSTVAELLQNPLLQSYKHHLTILRLNRPHLLTEQEEKILLEKEVVGRRSWTTLFNKILSSYKFGEKQRTEEEVLTDLYNPDRTVRKVAADELTLGLQENNHILTHIFNTLAADKMVTDRLRSHETWVSSMNLHNQLKDSTVDTLVEAVTSRYDIVARYYTLKKEFLGIEALFDYDRYAPLPSLPTTKVGWSECQKIVLDSFNKFSPEMRTMAARFFNEGWIHAPIMQGKRGGAFAHPCVPEVHPYVMVNYTGSLRDVSTVAHELGHGVHQLLAAKQGHFSSDTPLPLAETASVFAELLVFNSQLDLLGNELEKRDFICQKLESIFATVFRQTAMNRFENLMHTNRREKGELSSEELSQYWLKTQKNMFGESVELREEYSIWWSYIPHFLSTPGYVYSYAFGELLVLALYGIYTQEGEGFIEKYLALLSAGGSSSPYELMQPFGIDLDSQDFWQNGLSVIEDFLLQLEAS